MTGIPRGCRFLFAQDKDDHRSAFLCARDTRDSDHRATGWKLIWDGVSMLTTQGVLHG